jgi:hypothetical protein
MIVFMIARPGGTSWAVRLSVARRGGWRAWLTVSGEFERDLAGRRATPSGPRTSRPRADVAATTSA